MSWIKPGNRHKYEKMDYTRKPGEPKNAWWYTPLWVLGVMALAPIMFFALLTLWYIAVPITVVVVGYMAYKTYLA